ncbi:MAG: SURF1 family cytochrome oxidase biogenesis protein [Microbacteriaceae bacterium]
MRSAVEDQETEPPAGKPRSAVRRWRFAFSSRWLGYLALTVAFAVACVGLSMWQIARRDQALHQIQLVQQNYDRRPVPLAQALPTLGSYNQSQEWTPVTLTGRYLAGDQLLVRNRPFNGQPGFEVLTPLQQDDGTVFVVDRGWLPTGSTANLPDHIPAPPGGKVTVVARLMAGEPALPNRTDTAGSGQIATIQLHDIAKLIAKPTYTGAYGLMSSEDPAPTAPRPAATPKPAPDEGPHLSYAFQWLVFGILAFLALGWAIRQEYRLINADDPEERERAEERARRKAARQPGDGEIEDALIDQASETSSA